jgi:hypothetical protein
MNATRLSGSRRGFTLTVVLIFLVLMFALWTTVCRTSASLLRIQTARVNQDLRDEGLLNALALTLSDIEANPNLQQSGPNSFSGTVPTSKGPRSFTATRVYQGGKWLVTVVLQ